MRTRPAVARTLRAAITAALLFAATAPAGAATFTVDRVDIRLSASAQTALVTVRNDGDTELRFQIGVVTWSQNGAGVYAFAPTQDVVAFPTLLTLARGQSRRIRVGATTGYGATEKSYRLFIEELPGAARPSGGASVMTRTKVGIPVFMEPATQNAAIELAAASMRGGVLMLPLRNSGNVHIVAGDVVVNGLDAQGAQVFTTTVRGGYVLPGVTRTFEQAVPTANCRGVRALEVTLTVNGKASKKRTAVADGVCTAAP